MDVLQEIVLNLILLPLLVFLFSSMSSLSMFVISFVFIPLLSFRLEWLMPTLEVYVEWAEEEEEAKNKWYLFIYLFFHAHMYVSP